MLKSLSILPKEVKDVIVEFVSRPECVRVIDRAGLDEDGMYGAVYVVMKDGTKLWERVYQDPESKVMDFLASITDKAWDRAEGVCCTLESEPMDLHDIDSYIEGEDYRVLTKEEALREVEGC